MGFSYRVLKAYKNGLNVSTYKNGLNVSYTLDVGFGTVTIPLLGKRKKLRWTNQVKWALFPMPLNFLGSICNQVSSSSNTSK